MILDLDQTILHAIRIRTDFNTWQFVDDRNKELHQQIQKDFGFEIAGIDDYVNSYTKTSKYIKEHLLEMPCDVESKFIIKMRPYWEQFFQKILPLFDVYIYTKASRSYADVILSHVQKVLNPHFGKKIFQDNHILSRDETKCHNSKSLNRLFPPGLAHNIMIILDDNEKMWAKFKENYLHTKPYVFFQENETKNQQGINQDVESQARVYNPHDYWLFTASKSLEQIANRFWDRCEQGTGSILDHINQNQISIQQTHLSFKQKLLTGLTLYFAISRNHPRVSQQYLEEAKKRAQSMGAKIATEFKEQESMIVTNELRPIKSIKLAQERGVPIIHVNWVYDCDIYLENLPYEPYNLTKYGSEVLEEAKRSQRIKELLIK